MSSLPTTSETIDQVLTSKYYCWAFHHASECPARITDVLRLHSTTAEGFAWDTVLKSGCIYVNGRRVSCDAALNAPCKVEYYEPRFQPENAQSTFPNFNESWIVYNDGALAVCYKPPLLPSVPAKEQQLYNLQIYVENFLQRSIHLPSRLDCAASGLVLMSIDKTAHNLVQKLYEQRRINKEYLIEVGGAVPWDRHQVCAAIGRDPAHRVLRRVTLEGGQAAQTNFERTKKRDLSSSSTLLKAMPITGRTHQIRVHAQHCGFPIVGDRFYGGVAAPTLHLLCWRLSFEHPLSGLQTSISVPSQFMPEWASSYSF